MADKIKFLHGLLSDMEAKNSQDNTKPKIDYARGQVYFAVDGIDKGKIYFDAPDGTSGIKRYIMSDDVKHAANATTASNANNSKYFQANTKKLYLSGVASDPGTSGSYLTGYVDTGIYAGTTAGQLGAAYIGINGDNTTYRLYVNGSTLLAGPTVIKDSNFGTLEVYRNHDSNAAAIKYSNASGTLGYLGFLGSELIRWSADANTRYTILDSGNYTTYTVKKDGTGATGTWGISITGNAKTATSATYDSSGSKRIDSYVGDVFAGVNKISGETDGLPSLYKKTGAGATSRITTYVPLETNGKININYLPNAALERLYIAATTTETLATIITAGSVQAGDTVKLANGKMYVIYEETAPNPVVEITLADNSKYTPAAGSKTQLKAEVYSAGIAAAVKWSGITERPNLISKIEASDSTHTVFTVTTVTGTGGSSSQVFTPQFLKLSGGHVNGSVTIDDLTAGDLLVTGGATFTNTINGNLKGNVTGNLTGNVTGNVTGNLTGTADKAKGDGSGRKFDDYYMAFKKADGTTNATSINTANNVITFSNMSGSTYTIKPNNEYVTGITWTNGTTAGPTGTIARKNNDTNLSGIAIGAFPSASASVSGVVTTGSQTFAGNKTFNGTIFANNAAAAATSQTTTASIYTKGGIAVTGQMAAKTVKIDNNSTTKGCTLQFNDTYNCLEFVFA